MRGPRWNTLCKTFSEVQEHVGMTECARLAVGLGFPVYSQLVLLYLTVMFDKDSIFPEYSRLVIFYVASMIEKSANCSVNLLLLNILETPGMLAETRPNQGREEGNPDSGLPLASCSHRCPERMLAQSQRASSLVFDGNAYCGILW